VRSILEMPAPIEKTANRLPAGRAPLLAFVSDAATEKVLRDCLTQLSLAHDMSVGVSRRPSKLWGPSGHPTS